MIKMILLALLSSAMITGNAMAAVKGQTVNYTSGDGATLEGYVAYDDRIRMPRPGIVIVHDWMGISQFTRDKADELAKEGYVAFAADIYGEGVRPADTDEAAKLSGKYKGDRKLLRARVRAAYDKLSMMKEVNPAKMLVMGYCFGGTAALEFARSGAPLSGTASFHGGLATPMPEDAKNIKGPVLVMHGADDPFVPPAEVAAFKKEMSGAKVDLKFVSYPGAVHAFTNPASGNDNSKGMAYNAEADKKSWAEFEKFLKRVFK